MTTIAIIGGGVAGCTVAYHLQKAGVQTAVIERSEVASEASGAAAGLLAPLGELLEAGPITDLLLASWSRSTELIRELEVLSGVPIHYQQTGSLHIASTEGEMGLLRDHLAYWQSIGIESEWLTADEAIRREPLLGPDVMAAVYISNEGSMKAPSMTRAYAGAARKLGTVFYEHTEATGLRCSGPRVTGVQTVGGSVIACDHLVIAAGTWSAHCGEWLGFSIPVTPRRGQMLSLRQPEVPLQYILMGNLYLIPRLDGTISIGATVEQAGFNKQVTAGGMSALLTRAFKLVPGLANAPIVKMWAGLRPWSPDSYPILGKAPDWENVTLATGHCGIGFEASAITGQAIAELIVTGKTPEIIRPFSIERFRGELPAGDHK